MPKKYSTAFIVGVSILFLVPISFTGLVYYSLAEPKEERGEIENASESPGYPNVARESNIRSTAPIQNERGGAPASEVEGIPIGKYSNPPTSIRSTGGSNNPNSSAIDDLDSGSSIERNRQIQGRGIAGSDSLDSSVPDYTAPSSNNNFNREDNSLITPLEDEGFLEVPESDNKEEDPLSFEEPVVQP